VQKDEADHISNESYEATYEEAIEQEDDYHQDDLTEDFETADIQSDKTKLQTDDKVISDGQKTIPDEKEFRTLLA
jgi:hypothetical protein